MGLYAEKGIELNPLAVPVDPTTNLYKVSNHVYQVSEALEKIFKLGVQQVAALRKAMFSLYESYGIKKGDHDTIGPCPKFDELYGALVEQKDQKLLNRIEPLFDLGVFKGSEATMEELVDGRHVLRRRVCPTMR